MHIVIKKEFENEVVGFGKSGLPLGQRHDLDELAIIAHESGDPSILKFFEKLPSLAALKKAKTDRELKALLPHAEDKPTEEELVKSAVPEPFNKSTKVEELNSKPPSPGTSSK